MLFHLRHTVGTSPKNNAPPLDSHALSYQGFQPCLTLNLSVTVPTVCLSLGTINANTLTTATYKTNKQDYISGIAAFFYLFYTLLVCFSEVKSIMATIQKRAGRDGKTSYRVQVRLKGFEPETASFERSTDAKEWATKTEADMRAGRHFGQSKRHTFNDLADEYQTHAKDPERLKHWRAVFGLDLLDSITPSRIS